MKVAIVGAKGETHSEHMKNVLLRRGAEVILIDTIAYPGKRTLTLKDNRIIYQGIDLDAVDAFYIRSVFYSHPPYDLEHLRKYKKILPQTWYSEYAAERERQSLLSSFIRILPLKGKRVVNPADTFELHYLKPYQLEMLRKNNIAVPRTLVTNDPQALIKFKKEVSEVVYKPVAGGASCKKMEEKDWSKERLSLLRNAPVLFQEYIPGENIRVYVLNGRVIASAIIHTENVDYRGHERGLERIKLPSEVEDICIRATRICGLIFTGIDLKRKPDGKFVLIECNPSPMFIGFQIHTKDPIDQALAEYLIYGK